MKKGKKTLVWVIVIGLVGLVCAQWYLKENRNLRVGKNEIEYKKGKDVIFDIIPLLQGVKSGELVEILGEPKEIYKEKIYTYIDSMAKYDLLVEGTLKSVVMSMKYDLSIVSVDTLLQKMIEGYNKESVKNYKNENVHDRTVVTIYDVDKYSKIEISTKQGSSLIEYIKIKYK